MIRLVLGPALLVLGRILHIIQVVLEAFHEELVRISPFLALLGRTPASFSNLLPDGLQMVCILVVLRVLVLPFLGVDVMFILPI